MANNYLGPPSILRNVAIAAAALMVLGSGVAFVIRSSANNNTIIQQWETRNVAGTGTGHAIGYITSSGALTLSGNTLFADGKSGSGRIRCAGTDGCGVVLNDADGSGCWAIEVNNGTVITHGVPSAECP